MRITACITLTLGLLMGGAGGMWICFADGGIGLFAHAHSHGEACGDHKETDASNDPDPAAIVHTTCCTDMLLGGWLVAFKAHAGAPKVAAISSAAPLAILPRAASESPSPGGALVRRSRAPPAMGSYFLPLATLVLRL